MQKVLAGGDRSSGLSLIFTASLIVAAAFFAGQATAAAQAAAPATAGQSSPAASPTEIAGIWQGTLHIEQANRDLRTEIKIAKAADGSLKATFYSIDQGGQALVASSKTAFENGTLTFTMDAIGGKYEGKMSPDGKTITGTFTQGPNPLPLILARTTPDDAACSRFLSRPRLMAMTRCESGSDVVTVEAGRPLGHAARILASGEPHFIARNRDMNDLVRLSLRAPQQTDHRRAGLVCHRLVRHRRHARCAGTTEPSPDGIDDGSCCRIDSV